eukprot:scaffold1636_cov165-Ochromonas_danica.AAC.5
MPLMRDEAVVRRGLTHLAGCLGGGVAAGSSSGAGSEEVDNAGSSPAAGSGGVVCAGSSATGVPLGGELSATVAAGGDDAERACW